MNRFLVLVAFAALVPAYSHATVLDTRPPNQFLNYFKSTGPDAAGGTFFANDTNLASFSLSIGDSGTGGVFRAVVLLANGSGIPSGIPLFQSPDVVIPAATTEFTFTPNLGLAVGNEYFIGIDTGRVTSTTGGDVLLAFSPNLILGTAVEALNGGPFSTFIASDITSRIVMNAVPEPTACLMFYVGMMIVSCSRYRLRRR